VTEHWDEIHGFRSLDEYERFRDWLDQMIERGRAREIEVGERYGSPYFEERWVRQEWTGAVWRLVGPEPPFRGVFLPVRESAGQR